MNWYWYFLVFILALAGTMVVTPLSVKLAKSFDAIDYPDERRINDNPTPRLGGVAILAGVLLAVGTLYVIDLFAPSIITMRGITRGINYFGVVGSVALIFAVGLLDDIFGLSPLAKFAGQVVAAIVAILSGVLLGYIVNPFGSGIIHFGIFAYPITVFYLVAFANIINLIDGLDGLAAGIVAISAGALFMLALGKGGADAAIIAMALIGACLGFLRFNFHPARVFMGDSGALMLGFVLGVISLFGFMRTPVMISLLLPVVVAGIPVIDTFTSIVRRIRAGKSIAHADSQHIHHRIINLGLGQRRTVLIMYGLSIVLATCAVLLANYDGLIRFVVFAILCGVVILIVWRLGLLSSVLTHHYNKRARHTTSERSSQKEEHE